MPSTPPPFAACHPFVVPVSRSPLPAMFGMATQTPALQKPVPAQALSAVQLVPQVGGEPGEQMNPLQLWVVPATQEPAPLHTFVETMEAFVASQAGVESHIVVVP
jgi:hypothetical protein